MGNFFDVVNEEQEVNTIEIFTNVEAKPNSDWTWFYRAIGEKDSVEGGEVNLCNCDECKHFGKDIFEYFSIYTALNWVKENHPDTSILLWISSGKFIYDASEKVFGSYNEVYSCAFLRTLGKDLDRFLSKLDVEIFEYSYANKDIISIFF